MVPRVVGPYRDSGFLFLPDTFYGRAKYIPIPEEWVSMKPIGVVPRKKSPSLYGGGFFIAQNYHCHKGGEMCPAITGKELDL